MNQTRFFVVAAVAVAAASLWAEPKVTVSSVAQDEASRVVTISYTLSEESIVTMEFQTNGVVVAGQNARSVVGDVNRLLPATPDGKTYSITWIPSADGLDVGEVTAASFKIVAWTKEAPPQYLAVALAVASGAKKDNLRFYASKDTLPYPITDDYWKLDNLLLRRVDAAGREWRMGSPTRESNRQDKAGTKETPHTVVLTEDYYMGVYELTKRQCLLISGTTFTVSNGKTDDCSRWPLAGMSPNNFRGDMSAGAAYDWPTKKHAVDPSKPLGKLRALVDQHFEFDLPTEAQWEYAARAGKGTRFATDDESVVSLQKVGWTAVSGNKDSTAHCGEGGWPHNVGELQPNDWGFYDMLGNVGEWCLDWGGRDPDGSLEVDPKGPDSGSTRMARGTGFYWDQNYARCASRNAWWGPDAGRDNHGFRVCAPAVYK